MTARDTARLRWNPEINAGHVMQVAAVAIAAVGIYVAGALQDQAQDLKIAELDRSMARQNDIISRDLGRIEAALIRLEEKVDGMIGRQPFLP